MLTLTSWYVTLFGLGLLCFPLSRKLFGGFIDQGYAFAKTLGIIILSYGIFIAGIFKVLPFTKESLVIIIILIGLAVLYGFKKEIHAIKKSGFRKIALYAGIELLFFSGLFILAFVRGQEPSIHGLEKFMDFGFMQSILKSTYFPPLDMWLSADSQNPQGYPINYYYFGHLTGAVLTKLTGTNPFVSYNLILATILAQGLTLAFSLIATIVQEVRKSVFQKSHISSIPSLFIGLVGSYLVNLGGNLHTLYLFTTGYPNESPIPFWEILTSPQALSEALRSSGTGALHGLVDSSKYWYPNATRFIPFTIHEFPSYSYVVADLHGHVFDIPFVLLTLATLLVLFLRVPPMVKKKLTKNTHSENGSALFRYFKTVNLSHSDFSLLGILGFFIGINYMTNAFDGPIYLLLSGFMLLFIYGFSLNLFVSVGFLALSFFISALPFSWFFDPFASSIGVNCAPHFLIQLKSFGPFLFEEGNCQVSPIWMLFVLWGFFWISAFVYLVYLFIRIKSSHFRLARMDLFTLVLFGFGTFLIIIPEFFYIKDIYPGHFRANTMFKMGYQAFMIMGIASTFVLYRIRLWESKARFGMVFILLPFVILVGIYPFLAFPSYYGKLNDPATFQSLPNLDGLRWLENTHPQDYEMINYINRFVPGQQVIVEAQGDSYTDYNRISAYTGNPTIAGWWVHQWLWRGSSDVVGKRIPDIEALYQSEDVEETRRIIKKYDVQYVVVSKMEREKYTRLNEDKFALLGTQVFRSSDGFGALYKVN